MIIDIKYKDDNSLTYNNIIISLNDDREDIIFESGDFIVDWYQTMKWCAHNDNNNDIIKMSSSVNHFIMDGAKFDSAYLVLKPEPHLEYFDGKNFEITNNVEFFIPEDEKWSWDELKNYVNKYEEKKTNI